MRKVVLVFFLLLVAHFGTATAQVEILETHLVDQHMTVYGTVEVWNDLEEFEFRLTPATQILLHKCYIGIDEQLPVSSTGNPILGKFFFIQNYHVPRWDTLSLGVDLSLLGYPAVVQVAAYCTVQSTEGNNPRQFGVWAWGEYQFPPPSGGYWFEYVIQYP